MVHLFIHRDKARSYFLYNLPKFVQSMLQIYIPNLPGSPAKAVNGLLLSTSLLTLNFESLGLSLMLCTWSCGGKKSLFYRKYLILKNCSWFLTMWESEKYGWTDFLRVIKMKKAMYKSEYLNISIGLYSYCIQAFMYYFQYTDGMSSLLTPLNLKWQKFPVMIRTGFNRQASYKDRWEMLWVLWIILGFILPSLVLHAVRSQFNTLEV